MRGEQKTKKNSIFQNHIEIYDAEVLYFSITEQEEKDIYMNELPGQAQRNTSNNFKVTFLSFPNVLHECR
jgi:spore coat polysaccharide biosynthesis protein SpsF (cytidylyltransferase family)